ncbi:hypothetical protein LO80_04425 [Candidatus Francisella endociliophora]|uniref:Lipoprotein n=1 Tax=Candidatus Francisella endociliophora TaxID=653937 RepID=A0A097ENZ3_9GAMM|nr:hypothetical protein [Francisella sp. FSC1006]AIT09286.1 hypothetical protein LO80_04425 [Francisella sp. FSC1006]
MKKYKFLTVVLAGLVLASCINEKSDNPQSGSASLVGRFTAVQALVGNNAPANGGSVAPSTIIVNAIGTSIKFSCPAGEVGLVPMPTVGGVNAKTCSNSAGYDYDAVGLQYNSALGMGMWAGARTTVNPNEEAGAQNSVNLGGDGYQVFYTYTSKSSWLLVIGSKL